MRKISPKQKIYSAVFVWLLLCGLMFGYVFKLLDASNQGLVASINQENKELALLQAEQNSYKKAREDLAALEQQPIQPEDFFTQDTTLVNEIRTLENVSRQNNVTFNLGGLSGTVKTASSAKTRSSLARIPYSLALTGNFSDVVNTLEIIENLSFVTELTNINLSAGNSGVTVNSTAYFYVQK